MDPAFNPDIVIDAKGLLQGRLAGVAAKAAIKGQTVHIVRCEETVISGSQYRNQMKFRSFLHKHSNSNPRKHSHIHFREPSKFLRRVIRGMIPHKTPHGSRAYEKVFCYEGVPAALEHRRKYTVPCAAKYKQLRPGREFCTMKDLCKLIGWKHSEQVAKLEEARKVRQAAIFAANQKK